MSFHQLLLEYSGVPKRKTKRTFMEIAGFPHYENVCSNILAFFFDPSNEHGLRDLLMKALADCLQEPSLLESNETVAVYREYQTQNGGRIDICLETESHIIGIENKIFHWPANDFDDYWKTISSRSKKPLGVLLSPQNQKIEHPKFKSLSYSDLQNSVTRKLGDYMMSADAEYVNLLLSFFKTIQNLGCTTMDQHEFDFFAQNQPDVTAFLDGHNRFIQELNSRLQQVKSALSDDNRPDVFEQWNTTSAPLVHDFLFRDIPMGIDTQLTPAGWQITFFCRQQPRCDILMIDEAPLEAFSFMGTSLNGLERTADNRRYIFKKLPVGEPISDVVAAHMELMEKIVTAGKAR